MKTEHANSVHLIFHAVLQNSVKDEVRVHPDDMAAQGWKSGDCVYIEAIARAAAKLLADSEVTRGCISLTLLQQTATGACLEEKVRVTRIVPQHAQSVTFAEVERKAEPVHKNGEGFLARIFVRCHQGKMQSSSSLNATQMGNKILMNGNLTDHDGLKLRVLDTVPDGVVQINDRTRISVVALKAKRTSYSDIGGLSAEVAHVREMVELPLQHPEIFAQLGIDAPRGVLLYGPPGCGKTLIARAIAEQTGAHFLSINGPEIIQKHYGESEELLRRVFEEAQKHPSSILFIDEIDALAPNRETVLGEVEKRVVGQLLALMDGVASRGRVVVMAATNLPNSIDPALRRPGRFDREIPINPPTRAGRQEILRVHTRFMPLAIDVDLDQVAAITHGFLGADLAALCREAAMASVRNIDLDNLKSPIFVHRKHFQEALAHFRLSTMRELSTEVTETHWEDIGGLEEQKRVLKEALEWPLRYSDRFQRAGACAPRGILLTGESGSGKTLLAQAVGSTTEVNFVVARGPELLSKWVGESERGIREVFRRARQSAPAIIFFDEMDAIAPARGKSTGDGQIGDRMVGQLLLELDALDSNSGVVVLAATNRPDLIDSALLRPGRFDISITLPKPDRQDRVKILKVHCRHSPLGADVDFEKMADDTAGFNGAGLAALCQQAKLLVIRESVENYPGHGFPDFAIEEKHFQAILQKMSQA